MADKPGIVSRFRRSEIEKTTDSCSVCGEEINFFGMWHHMRTKHPAQMPHWLLWALAVILSLALPVVVLVIMLVLLGGSETLIFIPAIVAVIIVLQVVIDKLGKDWERKVSKEWKSAHPLGLKGKPKKRRGA